MSGAILPGARVGPNAVLQLAAALRARHGEGMAARVFADAGLRIRLEDPPAAPVAEADVAALHRALARDLPPEAAAAVAEDAGRRTADYLLAHRIPAPARAALRVLPAPLAARLLLRAVLRHAWTFAGSGRVTVEARPVLAVEIADNPLAAGPCHWHAAVFTRLFRALVAPGAVVRETACCADGAPACRFEILLAGNRHAAG
jgi:divinyl protochlorophyllide a 8-vinyl-reductase